MHAQKFLKCRAAPLMDVPEHHLCLPDLHLWWRCSTVTEVVSTNVCQLYRCIL